MSPEGLRPAADGAGAVALPLLAARMAAELDALASLAERLDSQFGALLEGGALNDPRYGLQDLDRLRQTAADLALVQRRLADALPHDLTVPIAPTVARLQLGDLAQRLRNGTSPQPETGGGVEFF